METLKRLYVTGLALTLSVTCAFAQSDPGVQERLVRAAEKLQTIEARATRVDDVNQLRNLQGMYGYYFDKALWDEVTDLFAKDGTMEIGLNGVFVGKDNIRKYLYSLTGDKPGLRHGEINNHFQLSAVITLATDGQSAKARWRALIQTGNFGKGSGGNWGDGIYENEYVRENGIWKISKLHFYVKFYAPYEGGWTQAPAEAALRYGKSKLRPDRPTSVRYQPYPNRFVPPFHYEHPVASASALAPARQPVTSSTQRAGTVAELEAQVRALELRMERLQAVDELENLESVYGYYVDKSMNDAIAALFSQNATLEILGRGVFIGRDRIYEYMRRLGAPRKGALFNHMQLQPVIHVAADGTTARLRARLFVMYGVQDRAAQWGEGIYENTFVREDGVWKYKNLHGYQTFYTDYESGWAKHSAGMFTPFPNYPPDLPQSVAYEVYPALFVPPFHYKHPVTGK